MEEVPLIAVHEALLENKLKNESKKILHDEDSDSDHPRNIGMSTTSDQNVTNTNDDKSDQIQQSDWVFIEEVPEYMKCNIICCNIFVAPQLLSCCGMNVCKRCIESYLQRGALLETVHNPSCPHCRKEEFRLIPNTALELSINQLKIKCLYQKNGCGWNGILRNGKLHLKECDFVPTECPNGCGCEKFERGKLHDHVRVCPLQYINCPFQAVGCSTGVLFLRTEWNQRHAVSSLHQHMLLIAQFNAHVLSECESNATLINVINEKSVKENSELICSQNGILESIKLVMKSLGDSLQEMTQKIDSLKHKVAAEKICLAELERKSKQLENTEASIAGTVEAVQTLQIPKPIGISCVQPVMFTIDNFRKRMTINDLWLSPPFYTHNGGYKMCISVQPNGARDAYGRFVSAGIHFLMGEYDDYLKWPFPGALITLTVMATQRNHSNFSIRFNLTGKDTKHIRSKQLDGGLGYGLEVSKFLDHWSAFSNFLTRDQQCLQLMVYHIQFLPL